MLAGKAADWNIGTAFLPYAGAILAGAVLVPILLPWIPGRSFALKGWLFGILATPAYVALSRPGLMSALTYLTLLPAIAGFLSLFFTGSSTYTNLSGVKKEMRIAVLAASNGKIAIADRDACMECGACNRNCPFGAVLVNTGVGCAFAVARGGNCDGSPDYG